MSTPNNPQGSADLGQLGRSIAEVAGQQLINGLLGGGAKRGLDLGLNLVKDIKVGDIISNFEKVFEESRPATTTPTTAASTSETPKEEVHIPFMKAESTPSAPAESVVHVAPNTVAPPVRSVFAEKEAPKPKPVDDGAPANESIDALYELATNHLTPAQHAELVTCVMNLVRHASPSGFTGEHVGWLSRLYGNKTI